MILATAAAAAAMQTRAESSVDLAEDNSSELVGISISFAVLTTILLAARFYAKRFQAGGVFADEIFLLLAWIVNLGMCALGVGELALAYSFFVGNPLPTRCSQKTCH